MIKKVIQDNHIDLFFKSEQLDVIEPSNELLVTTIDNEKYNLIVTEPTPLVGTVFIPAQVQNVQVQTLNNKDIVVTWNNLNQFFITAYIIYVDGINYATVGPDVFTYTIVGIDSEPFDPINYEITVVGQAIDNLGPLSNVVIATSNPFALPEVSYSYTTYPGANLSSARCTDPYVTSDGYYIIFDDALTDSYYVYRTSIPFNFAPENVEFISGPAILSSLSRAAVINDAGTILFEINDATDRWRRYVLGTPYDITHRIGSTTIGNTSTGFTLGGHLDPSGLHLYQIYTNGISYMLLEEPYGSSFSGSIQVLSNNPTNFGESYAADLRYMTFNQEGTRLVAIVVNTGDAVPIRINEYNLTTPFDLSTATFANELYATALSVGGVSSINNGLNLIFETAGFFHIRVNKPGQAISNMH